jgi:hypothetical protein
MHEHLGFLRVSSIIVKVAAWLFLGLGLLGGTAVLVGAVPNYPRWMGLLVLAIYVFFFFFFYIIAKIADLLIKIIQAINEIKKV